MASYQGVVAEFLAKLNRSDCTPTLAGYFLNDAMRRAQRQARLPFMETSQLVTAQGLMDFIAVPPDLLEIIDVYVSEPWVNSRPRSLAHMSFREISGVERLQRPVAYARLNATIQIRGAVRKGGNVLLVYYRQMPELTSTTSSNGLLDACPDLLVYGALSIAGDYFQHPQATAWEQRFQSILSDVQGQAIALEMTGGPLTIQPAYGRMEHSYGHEWHE